MNEFARKIDHLEVTIDPYAPLYSEPITFVDQCKLLSEPIKQLQIAWGNKDTFPRVLEILMRMNWYSQRLPLQPKGSFARPSGFMECSIKRAVHTLQILTTLSFYPRLPTIRKYQEIERVKLTAVIAALLSSVGEPAVNFEVVSYDDNHQLIRRKNEYERLDNFLNEDVESIHINFQDPPPKEFYSSIAIDLMHEIVPDDLMHDIAQAYDRNLRRFLQNFIGRNLIQAEVANPKLFNCLVTADIITQDLEFAYSGRRVDKTPLPHLQHEMEIVLAHKFKSDWSMEVGKGKYQQAVTLWQGEMWIRYPLGFEELAELAKQKWPFTEIPLNAQSLFSYCCYLGIVKQPPNSDLEKRIFLEPTGEKERIRYAEIACPAVVLNEPLLYMEETSAWANELKNCLPEKELEEKLKKKPNLKNIVADPDKKKADFTFSIRSKKESFLSSHPGSGSTIIAMASKMINAQIEKLEKEKQIMQGTPIELAKKSVNESALKAITKTKTQEMEEQLKKENLYPFNKEKPVEETLVVVTQEVTTPTEVKRVSGFTKFLKSVFTFFRGSKENAPPAVNSTNPVKESTELDTNSNASPQQVESELSKVEEAKPSVTKTEEEAPKFETIHPSNFYNKNDSDQDLNELDKAEGTKEIRENKFVTIVHNKDQLDPPNQGKESVEELSLKSTQKEEPATNKTPSTKKANPKESSQKTSSQVDPIKAENAPTSSGAPNKSKAAAQEVSSTEKLKKTNSKTTKSRSSKATSTDSAKSSTRTRTQTSKTKSSPKTSNPDTPSPNTPKANISATAKGTSSSTTKTKSNTSSIAKKDPNSTSKNPAKKTTAKTRNSSKATGTKATTSPKKKPSNSSNVKTQEDKA